jgi:selenium-binding protein 1
MKSRTFRQRIMATALVAVGLYASGALLTTQAVADETCQSPYMAKIVGQEDYVYVWTLGMEGLGDGQDKLVTVSTNPKSEHYGKVVASLSVGGRNEAHHSGFTDDRHYLWAGGLDTNKVFIFDVHTNPGKPTLHKVITDFVDKSGGVVGPHTTYALPGRMIITGLSNNKDHGGRTAIVEYTNEGEFISTYWNPTDDNLRGAIKTGKYADGYGYDVRVLPRVNAMFTSSFTGWSNYMMDFGKMLGDPEAMKRFGNTLTVWNLHTRKPEKVFDVPGAPLEIRCAWDAKHDYCFTTTALTSKIWLIFLDESGEWQVEDVADIGDASKVPLPVDISISNDDSRLWVNTFMDGKTRLFDITDPHKPVQVLEEQIGTQVNMVSSSWDSTRLYYTTSLLGNWDKKGDENEQFLKLYHYEDGKLVKQFEIDFIAEKLGRAHQMRFGAYSLYASKPAEAADVQLSELR